MVMITEGLSVGSNVSRAAYSLKSGVKNSSPHEGEKVITPSKSISIVSFLESLTRVGRMAKSASFPSVRDVKVVPNFLRYIRIYFRMIFLQDIHVNRCLNF